MMRVTTLVILFTLFFPIIIFGQGETSNWYFGNGAGIKFKDDGSTTPLVDGRLDTFEGCATISNSFGDLLFYTDGIIVYDSDHAIMQNGDNLLGDPSSTQSALIVPKPGDPKIFFIFTVDTSAFENDPDLGLNYSIVDISLNNGKGAVTQKNIPLLDDCSEKIAAVVKDCSEESIWLITFASANGENATFDTFHAFEINTSGVVSQSVKTTFDNLNVEDPRGYLKLSPDATKLANANMSGGLYIYDFDAASGRLSNQENIFISGSNKAPYGIEFSPSSKFLYTHVSNDIFAESGHRSSLLQYDLEAANISDSQEILDTRIIYRGALQLGNNGKIYRTTAKNYFEGNPFLSVIHNPNEQGDAANYEHEAVSLNGKNATQGLPPFIQSFFNKIELITNADGSQSSSLSICAGEEFTLGTEQLGGTYSWEKDGIPLTNSDNSLQISDVTKADSGKYRLTILTGNPGDCPIIGEALVEVIALPETTSFVLEQCDVDENSTDGFTLFDLKQASNGQPYDFTFYETLEDQRNKNAIANPETYANTSAFNQTLFYSVTNELNCTDTGEVILKVNPSSVTSSAASPLQLCDNSEGAANLTGTLDLALLRQENYTNLDVAFYTNIADALLEDNEIEENLSTTDTAIYVRVENDNQCLRIETIDVQVNPLPEVTLENSYQLCSDDDAGLTIAAPDDFDSYIWYKEDSGQFSEIGSSKQITITDAGNYSLEAGVSYGNKPISCTATTTFIVNQSNRAVFEDIEIEDFSNSNSITATVTGDGEYEFSLDGETYQNEPFFKDLEPGFYTLFARDKKGCGTSMKEVAVVGFPKIFTPNGDGLNDRWQLIGTSPDMVTGNISIHDRYGKLLKQLDVNGQGWDGNFVGQKLPASDYWFKITLNNGREFKGHFALKR